MLAYVQIFFWNLLIVSCHAVKLFLFHSDRVSDITLLKLTNQATLLKYLIVYFKAYPLQVRLSDYDPVPYAGCVEVKYTGIWGDVGQFGWDREDSRVVCRQLGFTDVLIVLWRCKWLAGGITAGTWMDNVQCIGNESSLTNCTHDLQTLRRSIGFDAGVVCENGSERGTW